MLRFILFPAVVVHCFVAAAHGAETQPDKPEVSIGAGTTAATTTGSSGPQKSSDKEQSDTSGHSSGDTAENMNKSGESDARLGQQLRCEVIRDPAARAMCEQRSATDEKDPAGNRHIR